jgi:anthranilate/para-aminobenzoate synthase component I
VAELGAQILSLASSGQYPWLSWLDGGSESSWFGVEADLAIEADDLAPLQLADTQWRADPSRVWIGWLTYDLGAASVLGNPPRRGRLAGLCLRRFSGAVEFGPQGRRFHGDQAACARLEAMVSGAAVGPDHAAWPLEPLRQTQTPADYRARVARAKEALVAGDTYQVNLSQRFEAAWRERAALAADVAALYGRMRQQTPATMGALMAAGSSWIVSNSPETLLEIERTPQGDVARSWPIKGTASRGEDEASDHLAASQLERSEKDLAEHVMIVDLVRNDLGRCAVPGTVQAEGRPQLITLPTVHHLVTQVSCTLRQGWTLQSITDAMFPGGSITGAPKRRTVEIIDALEAEPREIYCGAILVLHPDGIRMSIPIRTGILDQAGLTLRSGGGIVVDSDPEQERLETVAKARAFDPVLAGPPL